MSKSDRRNRPWTVGGRPRSMVLLWHHFASVKADDETHDLSVSSDEGENCQKQITRDDAFECQATVAPITQNRSDRNQSDDCKQNWLIGWLIDWLIEWLIGYSFDWMNESMTNRLSETDACSEWDSTPCIEEQDVSLSESWWWHRLYRDGLAPFLYLIMR